VIFNDGHWATGKAENRDDALARRPAITRMPRHSCSSPTS